MTILRVGGGGGGRFLLSSPRCINYTFQAAAAVEDYYSGRP